jgi:hypothetical protein
VKAIYDRVLGIEAKAVGADVKKLEAVKAYGPLCGPLEVA